MIMQLNQSDLVVAIQDSITFKEILNHLDQHLHV